MNAGDKTFFDYLSFQAHNAAAGTPQIGVVSITAFGTLNDDQSSSDMTLDITSGISNQNLVQFELAGNNRCAFGLQADSFVPELYDGQVDIQPRSDATKGLTLRQHSNTQSGAMIEIQKADNTPLLTLAANGRDWILDTAIGSQWATATNQKQAWWGATPIVQPGPYAVTNPTANRSLDETTATLTQVTQCLGSLIQDLQSTGLLG